MERGPLSRTVRVWTGIIPRGREAPKGRAISAVSAEVLSQEIRRKLRPESDPEALHAHPPQVRVIQPWAAPSAGHPLEAGSKGEDPGVEASEVPLEAEAWEVPPKVEALEVRPEAVLAAAGSPADFGIS
jgi:hypothetical protein